MSWFRWITFIFGWLLSPLTPWNDAILNIPIAYLLANFISRFMPNSFGFIFLACYWLTNLVGVIMILWSGHRLIKDRPLQVHSVKLIWIWTFAFSLLILLFLWLGWIKPF